MPLHDPKRPSLSLRRRLELAVGGSRRNVSRLGSFECGEVGGTLGKNVTQVHRAGGCEVDKSVERCSMWL